MVATYCEEKGKDDYDNLAEKLGVEGDTEEFVAAVKREKEMRG
jgi:hypothetical protein